MMVPRRKWQIMYKNIIYVSLADPDFQNMFAERLASVSRNLDIRTATDVGVLSESFSRSFKFNVCIYDEVTEKNISSYWKSDDSCICIRLTYHRDSVRNAGGENELYAYEGARETAERIGELISERTGEKISFSREEERPVTIAVFSCDGGTGVTAVAAGITAMIPVMYGEKVLYIGYGPFAGAMPPLLPLEDAEGDASGESPGSLPAVLYRIRKGKAFDINRFIRDGEGWGVLKTGTFNPGYGRLEYADIDRIGVLAAAGWGAGYLLLDLGSRLDENAVNILSGSDIVIEVSSRGGRFIYETIAGEEGGAGRKYIKIRNRWKGEWSREEENVIYISEFKELTGGSIDTRFGTELAPAVREIAEGK